MNTIDLALPQAVEAEKTILGVLMLDNERFYECVDLQPHMFSLDSHRRIYRHISQQIENDESVDLVTMISRMGQDEVQAVGGVAYMASLTEDIPRKASITSYIRNLRDTYARRRIISACYEASQRAADKQEAITTISFLQSEIEAILDNDNNDDPLVRANTVKALDNWNAERKFEREPGLSYGIPKLDVFSGGMRRGEVAIVGARSGVGKTSLMCQAAVANASNGIPSHLFSLEMTREQIMRRIWSMVSGIPYKRVSDPWLCNMNEAARINEVASEVAEWPLRIHDNSEMNLSQIVSLARVSMRQHGTRFIAVDYAQEIDSPGRDERTKVMMTARKLSRMVKHENCSLMLLSQLVKTNRENYNKPPVVGDLIESGKLENVAHIVLLLHRGWDEEAGKISDAAEILIPKQRRGETGVIQAHFDRSTITFSAV